jgi:2'-5' RNA ligase
LTTDPTATTAPDFSAVAVPIAAADPIGGTHRAAYDRSASWGVPPHITVVVPFMPPDLIDEDVVARLAAAVADVAAFDCTFASPEWFGEDVLWLAPQPSEPFRALTDAVVAAFPAYPPYGGTVDDPIPHLTVGTSECATPEQLRAVEVELRASLPFRARVDHALLIAGNETLQSWHTVARLSLGDSRGDWQVGSRS